ncbi:MAG: hypothetical protein M1820_010664 [Bogoriella megaspora]|nr:MAG: hypothetical protein M1820_010664 [Bogoriella megaspora]
MALQRVQLRRVPNGINEVLSTRCLSASKSRKWFQSRMITVEALDSQRDSRERVIVLGSGWAGYNAARKLDPKKFQAVVVSPRSYFVFTPLLASTAVGTLEFRTALEPVRSRRTRVSFFQGWADGVDFNKKEITIEEAVDDPHQGLALTTDRHADESPEERRQEKLIERKKGQLFNMKYDKLIIAVGCYSQTFNTPGVKENALFLKDVGDARKIRKRLLACFETAALPTTTEEMKRQLLRFVVVGGGPTGIEFSAEMHDIIKEDLAKLYPDLMPFYSITVYDVAKRVLSMFDQKLAKYAMDTFRREGISIKTSHHVQELRRGFPNQARDRDIRDPLNCYTLKVKEDGEMGTGMVVWSTGLMMNPFVEHALSRVQPFPSLHMQYDKTQVDGSKHVRWLVRKDPKTGSILTDDRLRLTLEPEGSDEDKPKGILDDVFAVGDCAILEGTAYPATAQVASQKAEWLAKRLNKGDLDTQGFKWNNLGVMGLSAQAERKFKTLDETLQPAKPGETLPNTTSNAVRRKSSVSDSRPKRSKPRIEDNSKRTTRPASPPWEDVDEERPRRKSTSRPIQRANTGSRRTNSSSSQLGVVREDSIWSGQESNGFFPKLARILENNHTSSPRRRSSSSVSSGSDKASQSPRSSRAGKSPYALGGRQTARARNTSQQRLEDSLSNPSMVSLVSGVSGLTNSSSGSNSTITQKSYNKSNIEKHRRSSDRARRESREPRRERSVSPRRSHARGNPKMDRSDVFAFMEPGSAEDNHAEASHASSSSSAYAGSDCGSSQTPATSISSLTSSPVMARTHASSDERRQENISSLDHDTSTRGSSSERSQKNPIRRKKFRPTAPQASVHERSSPIPQSIREEGNASYSAADGQHDSSADHLAQRYQEALRHQQMREQAAMQAYYRHAQPTPPPAGRDPDSEYHSMASGYYQRPPPAPEAPSDPPHMVAPYQYQYPAPAPNTHAPSRPALAPPDTNKTSIIGYELLASKLSSTDPEERLQPAYRKFEHLNHRVILHLQDEVSELEEELRLLDECIAQDTANLTGKDQTLPASRRAEAKAGGELHFRRVEVLGRIFVKTGQYNQALTSYNTLLKSFPPASPPDIHAYKTWLSSHNPIVEPETRFLTKPHDLITPTTNSSSGGEHSAGSGAPADPASLAHLALFGLPLALLVPLAGFSVVPGLWGRLIVLVMVVFVGAVALARSQRGEDKPAVDYERLAREWCTVGAL